MHGDGQCCISNSTLSGGWYVYKGHIKAHRTLCTLFLQLWISIPKFCCSPYREIWYIRTSLLFQDNKVYDHSPDENYLPSAYTENPTQVYIERELRSPWHNPTLHSHATAPTAPPKYIITGLGNRTVLSLLVDRDCFCLCFFQTVTVFDVAGGVYFKLQELVCSSGLRPL
ncbi:hypothetical protein BDZ91DRAFT_710551 [Kalaharituber pfeilii]|nr:hypothetical protein BDZ91DRAFT_710551 [Kalaharituber pfeilii]